MNRVFSKILALLLVFVLGSEAIMPTMSYADEAKAKNLEEIMDDNAKVEKDLKTLGILIGGTGVDINSKVTRHEMITLITRILGQEKDALNGSYEHPFTDVAKWANKYVAFAYSKEITKGTSATTFSGYNNVDANQVITLLLRALKYEDGKDFNWKEAYSFAIEKGILTEDMKIDQENFTRNDLNKIVKAFLEAYFKDQKVTLIQSLIKDGVITEEQLKELLVVSYKTEELKDEKLPEAKPTSGGGGGGGASGGGGSTPSAPVVTLDSITAVKTITTYKQDEEVKLDDLVVSANYSDKTTKVVTTYTTNLSELDLTTIGEKTLVITYKENNKEVKTEVKLIIARRLIDLDEYKIDGITYKVNRENNTAEVIDVDDSVINAVILSTLDTYVKDGIEYEIKNHYTVTSIYGELFQNEEGKYTDVKGFAWNLNSVYDYSKERINSLHYDTIVKIRTNLKTNSGAFANKKNLKTVYIPNTIVHIGDGAFINCTSLESVVLPNKLEVINAATFYNCKQVEYFYIPKTVQFIHPLFNLDENNSIRIVYEGSIDDMKKMIFNNTLYLNKKVEFENGNVKIVAENLYVSKTKTTYEYGEKINLDDLLVTVEYNNKTKKEITNYTTNIEDIDTKVSGEKTLVVIYKEDNKEVKAEIKLTVKEKVAVTSISATKTKTTFEYGEVISLDDLAVTATYSNGTTNKVTNYITNVKELDSKKAGSKTLVITYKEDNTEVKDEIKLTVKEQIVVLESISAVKTKTSYKIGEQISLDDLVVTAKYTDNSTKQVKDYTTTLDRIDQTIAGDKKLKITYKEDKVLVTTEVTINFERENPTGGYAGKIDVDTFEIDGITYKVSSKTDKTAYVSKIGNVQEAKILDYIDEYTIDGVTYEVANHYKVTSIYGTYGTTTSSNYIFHDGESKIYTYSGAAKNNSTLKKVTIPNTVKEINAAAFYECTNLTEVKFEGEVDYIGRFAFKNCTSLETIKLPKGLTTIDYCEFYGCSKLKTIYIPNDITTINYYAFDNCSSLRSVYYEGTYEDWMNISIKGNNQITSTAVKFYESEF